jgi:hypothetical protein
MFSLPSSGVVLISHPLELEPSLLIRGLQTDSERYLTRPWACLLKLCRNQTMLSATMNSCLSGLSSGHYILDLTKEFYQLNGERLAFTQKVALLFKSKLAEGSLVFCTLRNDLIFNSLLYLAKHCMLVTTVSSSRVSEELQFQGNLGFETVWLSQKPKTQQRYLFSRGSGLQKCHEKGMLEQSSGGITFNGVEGGKVLIPESDLDSEDDELTADSDF